MILLCVWATLLPSSRSEAVCRHTALSNWQAVFTFRYVWVTATPVLDYAPFEYHMLEIFRKIILNVTLASRTPLCLSPVLVLLSIPLG